MLGVGFVLQVGRGVCATLNFVPRFRESSGTLNLIRLSLRPSLCLSVRHKNFNLGHNVCTITGRALIL